MENMENRYLDRLSDLYPTIAAASTEIINLQAILNLPKGTEHFLTDVHGEDEAFSHVLRNGSGAVRSKIEDVFGNTMSVKDKKALATLIYYPKAKMEQVKRTESNMDDWYRVNLYRLIEVSKRAASKYTRSKVRKSLPKDFSYVIEELIHGISLQEDLRKILLPFRRMLQESSRIKLRDLRHRQQLQHRRYYRFRLWRSVLYIKLQSWKSHHRLLLRS